MAALIPRPPLDWLTSGTNSDSTFLAGRAGRQILPTYYMFPFERPDRDAGDHDAAQKFVYLKLGFAAEIFQLTIYFPMNGPTVTQGTVTQPKSLCT